MGLPDFHAAHHAGAAASSPAASSASSDLGLGDGIVRAWEGDDHACFTDGVYTVPRDGLYAVTVSVQSSDSKGEKKSEKKAGKKRKRGRSEVEYAVRVEEDESVEVMDVGSTSFGEVLHLAKGARVAIVGCDAGEGKVEWGVQRVMRKRKVVVEEVSERELMKRAKKKRKLERKEAGPQGETKGEEKSKVEDEGKGDVGDTVDGAKDGSGESEGSEDGENWEEGFESDASGEDG